MPHWIEHNESHGAEFRKWAAAARVEGAEDVAKLMDKAAANMVATGELLKKTGLDTGGHGEARHHPREHDHDHG